MPRYRRGQRSRVERVAGSIAAERGAGRDVSRGGRIAVVAGVVALAAAAVVVTELSSLYEVKREGSDLLPYETGVVYEVEVLGTATIYADAESRPRADAFIAMILFGIGAAAFIVAMVLRTVRGSVPRKQWLFHILIAIGAAALAIDELFGVHETIGHNTRFLADLPGVDAPDDVIFGLLAVPAIAFLVYFRDVILSSRTAMALFGACLALGIGAGLMDVIGGSAEEAAEALAAVSLAAGYAILARDHLSAALRSAGVSARVPTAV